MNKKFNIIVDWLKLIGIATLVAIVIENFVFSFAIVNGQSMFPTLETQNRLLIARLPYVYENVDKGDLIIFNPPNTDNKKEMFIKRVVANENDHFFIKDDIIYINGKKQDEEYICYEEYLPRDYKYLEGTVPKNMVFVMGDNRNDSNDSRMFGFVSKDNIKGKVLFKIWPLDEMQAFFTYD